MVYLNESVTFNVKSIKLVLSQELNNIIEQSLYFHIGVDVIDKVKKNIEKGIKNILSSDHHVYLMMDDKICTYKHKRGKKEGYFCNKKINTNIGDAKPDYLCCKHSKLHIAKKRKNKISKDINLDIDLNRNYINKKESLNLLKYKKKNKFKKNIKIKKFYICNSGLLDIAKIINNLNN